MRKSTLFTVFAVLVLGVVGLGFYRGWFVLSSSGSDAGDNKVDVNLTVDPDQAKRDAQAVETKAREITGTAAESPKQPAGRPADEAEPPQTPADDGQPAGIKPKPVQSNDN